MRNAYLSFFLGKTRSVKEALLVFLFISPAYECIGDILVDSRTSILNEFSVTNKATTVQTVASVRVSCGCLSSQDIVGLQIAPGSTLPFNVVLNPDGMRGRLSKTVSVTLSPSGETQVFPVEVFVRVRLAFDRRDAAFGVVSDDADDRSMPLRLFGEVANTAHITSVSAPPCPVFQVDISEDRGGVVVSLPSASVRHGLGVVAETWIVKTDDAEIPEIRLPVSAIFESRISIVPSALAVAPDEPVCSRTVLLRPNEDASAFKVLSAATKPRRWGDTTITRRPLGDWMIRVDGIDPDTVRQFSKSPYLEITTDMDGAATIDVPLSVSKE